MVQSQFSSIKEQLLSEYLPDDMCPLGNQLSEETSNKVYQVYTLNSNKFIKANKYM